MQLCGCDFKFLASVVILLARVTTAISLNCDDIRVDGHSFNFHSLGGHHAVGWEEDLEDSIRSWTFTTDICRTLGKKTPGVPPDEDCTSGTNVCGIARTSNKVDNTTTIIEFAVPIAGNFIHEHAPLDPRWTRFKSSPSHSDREKEGLRLEIHGKKYLGYKQKAVIEFICDKKEEERRRRLPSLWSRDDGKDDDEAIPHFNEEEDDGDGGRLKFLSYNPLEGTKILSLEWTTKHACEDAKDETENGSKTGHWGFFTWLIIILFLAIAAYLIFGSWINYSRYSARGWDLVPHSETIRDLPYLLRDWVRRVVNTIQGGGSRGGYSAV